MRRFYALPEQIAGGTVTFDADESKHIASVLRLEKGEKILVSDGSGTDYVCTLTSSGKECRAQVEESHLSDSEPETQLVLFQSIIKNEKMDYAIQKAAELGVSRIVPVMTERTVVKFEDAGQEEHKRQRWQKIALEACKQCGRSRVPQVDDAVPFALALPLFASFEQKLVFYEEETTVSVSQALPGKATAVAYFIGPEGGITKDEHQQLKKAGAVSASLGKRILRAETAAVVGGAVILYQLGELHV